MDFRITSVKFYEHPPNTTIVDHTLVAYGTSLNEIEQALRSYHFAWRKTHQGFQVELGEQLRDLFANLFDQKGWRVYSQGRGVRYSPRVDLRADLCASNPATKKGIYIEMEFRPNECKDLVKFEIGHKNRLADLGILVVAQDRDHINPNYTSMPEFAKSRKIVAELRPQCPILLIGIDGEWL